MDITCKIAWIASHLGYGFCVLLFGAIFLLFMAIAVDSFKELGFKKWIIGFFKIISIFVLGLGAVFLIVIGGIKADLWGKGYLAAHCKPPEIASSRGMILHTESVGLVLTTNSFAFTFEGQTGLYFTNWNGERMVEDPNTLGLHYNGTNGQWVASFKRKEN